MIYLKDFSIGYNEKLLLSQVTTKFPAQSLTALIGRNGTGKSTLLKAICGLNNDYKGEILIDGEDLRKISRLKLSKLLAYVNTQRPRLSNLKCHDVVALGRSPYTGWYGKITNHDEEIISRALHTVGMISYSSRNFNSLSDGECQKIMIARAISQDTPVIVLDEPTSFLDLPTRHELCALLRRLAHEDGKCIIFSTHELDLALRYSDFVALIGNEQLINLPAKEMGSSPYLNALLSNSLDRN